jgi:hypothetical protein
MNMVAIWFGIIERQAIHRGTFGNVRELTTAIRTYITGWLQQPGSPLRLDRDPRGNSQESQPSPNFKRGPPALKWRSILLTSKRTGSVARRRKSSGCGAPYRASRAEPNRLHKRKALRRMNSS